MHYSLKQSLLAGASALVLGMGASGAARAADADARINATPATVYDNTAVDNGSVRNNRMENSNNNGAGIVHEQQNNGSNNAVSAATASTANLSANANVDTDAVTNSTTHDNDTVHNGYVPQGGAAEQPDRTNEIVGSFNGYDGIATVQQNNGDNNEIGAATANYGSAASLGNVYQDAIANSQTFDQTGNGPDDALVDGETVRGNLIDPTFNSSTGIATVQQNNGNANAIAAATSVVGTAIDAGDVDQFATANANSDDNDVVDQGGERSNEILNSFVNADGVITVQQNNGDANAMSAATAVFGADGDAASLSQTALAEDNNLNDIEADAQDGAAAVDRSNLIDPSFNGADGTVTVQQNNGSANQIAAATAVAGVGGNVAGDVDQDARANFNDVGDDEPVTVNDDGQTRDNGILDSFNNATGVITVQQNNGDGNTINAATAVAGVVGSVGGDLSQNVESDDAEIDLDADVDATDGGSTRSNTIDPSFQNAAGVVTVQQNNGSANAMQASTAVAGVQGSVVGSVTQDETDAEDNAVERPHTVDNGSDRGNTIADRSFNGAAGTVTVQQNNGDANTMNASTAVVAVTGAVGGDLSQDADAEQNTVDYSGVAIANSTRKNAIDNSFNNADGTMTVQQNNGNANSMNAATAVAAAGSVAGDVTQGDELDADENDIEYGNIDDNGSDRRNHVTDSFNNVNGTTIVQQNNGTGNSMNSATAVLVTGVVGGDLTQDVDLDNNEVEWVDVDSANTWRENNIDPSFTNADGIHTVQQNNGDANTMNAGVAVASVDHVGGDVTQTVDADNASVYDVAADDDTSVRHNLIDNSFDGADGIITVQQNNGNANVLQAGSAVLRADAVGGPDQLQNISQTVDSGGSVTYSDNDVDDVDSDRNNAIRGSFERAQGIVTVQQNNGDSNVLSAATAVADLTGNKADFDDNLTQAVKAGGFVKRVDADDDDTPSGTVDTQGDGGRYNVINPSFTNSAGVATVQQNNGSNNVVASSTGVMVAHSATDSLDGTLEHVTQSADADGTVLGSEGTHDSLGGHPPPYDRSNDLASSFNGFDGVATVQQNNGDNNVMASATAVAANFGTPLADDLDDVTSTADTSGTVTNNDADDTASNRENSVASSFNSASGIVTVQQNNGNNNVVASATTVAANFDTASPHDDTSGTATGSASIAGNHADASDLVDRVNAVTGSFAGFKGLANVQQNNGANNVMGAATTVSASNQGSSGFGPAVSLASLGASVTGNTAHIAATNGVDPGYSNLVSGSFNNAAGVITVQQNTGSNNAIQSAISVTANFN